MVVCDAVLKREDNDEIIAYEIVTEKSEIKEKTNCTTAYISMPIADAIMEAICKNKQVLFCNQIKYRLLYFSCSPKFNDNNPYYKRYVDFSLNSKAQKIYIYKQQSICGKCLKQRKPSDIENVMANIKSIIDKTLTFAIDIQYCRRCNEYFVDFQSLKSYEKKYGVLLIERMYDKSENYGSYEISFAPDTIISRFGYSAQEGGLTVGNGAGYSRI